MSNHLRGLGMRRWLKPAYIMLGDSSALCLWVAVEPGRTHQTSHFLLQTVAGDLLETVRKTESSLKRLKKHRGAGDAPAEGAASDTDKMTTQLFLDVQVSTARLPNEPARRRHVWLSDQLQRPPVARLMQGCLMASGFTVACKHVPRAGTDLHVRP